MPDKLYHIIYYVNVFFFFCSPCPSCYPDSSEPSHRYLDSLESSDPMNFFAERRWHSHPDSSNSSEPSSQSSDSSEHHAGGEWDPPALHPEDGSRRSPPRRSQHHHEPRPVSTRRHPGSSPSQ